MTPPPLWWPPPCPSLPTSCARLPAPPTPFLGAGPDRPRGEQAHGLHRKKDTHIKSDPRFPVQLLFRFAAVSLQKVLWVEGKRKQAWSGVAGSRVVGTLALPRPCAHKAWISLLLVPAGHVVSALQAQP